VQSSRAPFRIDKTASDVWHLLAKVRVAGRGEAAAIARQAIRPAERGRMALGGVALNVHAGPMRSVAYGALGPSRGAAMTPLVWIAVVLMVMGAVMLIAGIGAPGLWIAVVTVGIAVVVIDRTRSRHRLGS
jgi:hypothetical protein